MGCLRLGFYCLVFFFFFWSLIFLLVGFQGGGIASVLWCKGGFGMIRGKGTARWEMKIALHIRYW